MTEAVRVIALCMGAALFSVSLRMHRPELAALFSLAVGAVALWMLREPFTEIVAAVRQLQTLCGLPANGSVDQTTWDHLCKLYALASGDGDRPFGVPEGTD